MLKVLVKKQMAEVFRSYFYNRKTNKARSKANRIVMFLLFGFLMVGVLGGTFTFMAIGIAAGLAPVGMGWLYFALMSGIAITLGTFGGVFSTYSGLYLPKDNDLLLSMPIPVRLIILSRLVNVYLLGAMYAGVVLIPTLVVWWIVAGANLSNVICGILLFLIVTLTVLLLSCVLGWLVAKISLKLKNKSFITVLISLLFIVGYYFVYFKAQEWIKNLVANATAYGESIKGSAYVLYLFGRVGEGDWLAAGIFTLATVVLLVLVLFLLSRGFLKLATASGNTKKVRYTEKAVKQKSVFGAVLSKEFARFTSSPNYMLNCGLGVLLLPAFGVFLLIKGAELLRMVSVSFEAIPSCGAFLLCFAMMLFVTMNDMAAPSVSLEGKSVWIPQSLPIDPKTVLKAKTAMQLILTAVPALFASVCGAVVVQAPVWDRILLGILPLSFAVFMALFGSFLGVKNPNLEWTTEIVPIKQSGAVALALFGGWGFVAVFAVPYLFVGQVTGLTVYLLLWTLIFAAVSAVLYRWLITKGAKAFSKL